MLELSELFDVIENCRRTWKKTEGERGIAVTSKRDATVQTLLKGTPLSRRLLKAQLNPETEDSTKKRPAVSPVDPASNKKARTDKLGEWQTVRRGKSKYPNHPTDDLRKRLNGEKTMKTKLKRRPDAVLVKPTDGFSYAEVLKNLRSKIKPEEAKVVIRSVRKTKTGDILLEISKGGNTQQFCDSIKETLKGEATVKEMRPKVSIEIRDLDGLKEEAEVVEAVRKATQNLEEDVKVRLSNVNSREQKRAFITL